MKRTLSGELSPSPSAINTPDGQPADADENHQQQVNHTNNAAPAMRVPAANDPPPQNPLRGFDPDEELPDWDEFVQMLPHTPPVENRRSESQDEASSVNDDENSDEEDSGEEYTPAPTRFRYSSDKDLNAIASQSKFKQEILRNLAAGKTEIRIERFKVEELQEILEICNRNPQVTHLMLCKDFLESYDPQIGKNPKIQQSLIEFFNKPHTIKHFEISLMMSLGMEIQPQLLAAIFCSESLSTLSLSGTPLADASPDECKSVTENLRRNTNLKNLHLNFMTDKNIIQLVLDPLAKNSGLEMISIDSNMPVGAGESVAMILESNQNLKYLKIFLDCDPHEKDSDIEIQTKEFQTILNALSKNSSLERLKISRGKWREQSQLLDIIFKKVMASPGLKKLDFDNFDNSPPESIHLLVELITKHPTLNAVSMIPIPTDEPSRNLFFEGLKLNPNLNLKHIGACWVGISNDDVSKKISGKRFLDSLKNFTNLSSITLIGFPDLDALFDFLKFHPNINEINLPDKYFWDKQAKEKILALVRSFSHIQEFTWGDERYFRSEESLKFRNELKQALLFNKEITSDATILSASAAMAALLLEHSKANQVFPVLNPDILKLLVEALTRYLPPAKAKGIFDELILHAPKHH